ncbi:murein biosynthesis integral membrane protein MurJ [Streptacidiphilus melanogenes]|uniref:murein biosynthesis integral membrane protein MurJ n=1 Tax=Streptacidiphilus melanogenes TaxID=411235 RepID=UPI00126A5F78|nr:lipid II flippase MurJ [Streptacidiphilus melanogenes]
MSVTTAEDATEEETGEAAVPAAERGRGFVAKAFGVTALFSAAGSVLGLVRDLLLARFYGAGSATDAFLVSWTVPETAAPLLIEDGMAFLTVPAFSAALAARGQSDGGPSERGSSAEHGGDAADPVRALVAATLPPLALALALLSALVALGAPVMVHVLAPGLADPRLAVVCTRLAAVTVLPFGLVGYLGAGLRSHHRFTLPGAVYIAYNAGILTVMLLLHASLGVRAAAGGVALGSVLMVAVLLPAFARHVSRVTVRRLRAEARGSCGWQPVLNPMAVLPVVLFTLTRQAQVFVERFIGSSLPPGTISHLNYAEKVAQNVMIIGILVCTVTFPLIARALAEGDVLGARTRVEKDLGVVGAVVLAGTVVVFACAPQLVAVLFERGAFTAADTAATALLMRVYCLGLLAQGLVGALIRPYLAARPAVGFGGEGRARPLDRTDWLPIWAMGAGLLVTIAVAAGLTPHVGAAGLAAGNATGISVTAVLLLRALRARGIPVRPRAVLGGQLRLLLAAAGAAVPAWLAANIPGLDAVGAFPPLVLGTLAGLLSFLALAAALRAPEITGVTGVLGPVRDRLAAARPPAAVRRRRRGPTGAARPRFTRRGQGEPTPARGSGARAQGPQGPGHRSPGARAPGDGRRANAPGGRHGTGQLGAGPHGLGPHGVGQHSTGIERATGEADGR